MASSMASRVPEPMEKCAVRRASPRSTALPADQASFQTLGKLRQIDLLEINGVAVEFGREHLRSQ